MSVKLKAKKALSVFMAVLMVMSMWGGVTPFSFKASALKAGTYDVVIKWQLINIRDTKFYHSDLEDYTGESSFDKNSSGTNKAGISLFYKKENGTDNKEYEVYWSLGNTNYKCGEVSEGGAKVAQHSDWIDSVKGTYELKATLPGFPTKIFACLDDNHIGQTTSYAVKSITVNGTTIWASKTGDEDGIFLSSTNKQKYVTLYSDYSWEGYDEGESTESDPQEYALVKNVGTKNWKYPTYNKVVWDTSPSTITIDTGSTTKSTIAKFHVEDQYGVKMSTTALSNLGTPVSASVKATNYPEINSTATALTTSTDSNFYYTTKDTDSTYNVTVYAKSGLKSDIRGLNQRYVTVTAKVGTKTSNKYFYVNDPKYTVNFNANGGDALIPSSAQVYYGESLESQQTIDKSADKYYPTSGTRTGYSFLGIFDAKTGGSLINTDESIKSAKNYYAHWDANTYTVVFLDRIGKYLDIQYVPYDTAADADKATALLNKYEYDEGDDTGHWELNDDVWSPSVSAVHNDMITTAQYTYVAHTFGDVETMEANCLHGTGTKQVCTVCGYEKTSETSTEKGSHSPSTDMTVRVAPTCTETGKGAYKCELCGDYVNEFIIDAEGHSFTHEVTKAATCAEEGVMTYTCTKCGTVETETIAKIQHDYKAGTYHNATCASSGYTEMVCSVCGDTYNKYGGNASTDHEWTFESTESEHGKITVTGTCSICNANFETEVESDHKFTNITTSGYKAPTCKEEGSITLNCGVEGCVQTHTITLQKSDIHNYTTTVNNADCTTAGSVVNTCSVCGDTDEVTTLPVLGHDWGSGTVNAGDEATCTKPGTRTYTCSRCSEIKKEEIPATGHSLVTIDATCTTDGKKVCSKCGYTEAVTTGGHNFGEETTLIAPTCVNKGLKIQTCSKCTLSKVTELDKVDHDWANNYTVDYDSTCSTVGQKSIHCNVCGEIKDGSKVEIDKKAHKMGESETVLDATCTGKGLTKTVCENCGYTVTSETPALGHEYKTTSETQATCTTAGVKVEKCSRCNDENTTVTQPTGHNYVAGTPVASTCTSSGYIPYSCTNSGCTAQTYNVINGAPIAHDWQITSTVTHDKTTFTAECSVCHTTISDTVDGSHKFTKYETKVQPTCLQDGEITVKCEVDGCEKSYTINIGKGSHEVETNVKEPTCSDTGTATTVCKVCKQTISTATIKAKGHNYTATITKNATCSAKGEITYTCSTCGDTYTEENAIDANAHKYIKGIHHDATCTTPAYDEYKCEYCDSSYNNFIGEANGHKYETTTTQSDKVLNIICKCSVCGDTHTATADVSGIHNYDEVTAFTAPTCVKGGEITIKCTDDGCTSTVTATIAKDENAHNLKTTYTAPTCDSEGSVITACTNDCTYVETNQTLSALGHDWNDGTVTTEATCTENGEKTFNCSRCAETKTEVIAKLGHSWDEGTNHDADCTHGAYTTYECNVCDETYDAVVDGAQALDHDWNDGTVTTEATCTTNGVRTYTCSRCAETKTEVIAKTGHNMDAGTPVKATCTTGAYTIYKCTNTNCEFSYNDYDATQPAIGHNWGEWKVTTEATNTTDGSMTRTCENDPSHKEECTIPAGGHTFDTENPTVVEPATCTAQGKETYACTAHTDCGVTLTVKTAKIQHELTTDYIPATCTAGGSVVTTCDNCGYKDSLDLPTLGHDYVKGKHVDADCTHSGYDVYTCSRCSDVKNVISEEAKGHDFKEVENSNTATCENAGKATYKCENCETTLDVGTTALGHDYSVEQKTVEATCNSVGYTIYNCSRCDSTHTEYAQELGKHTFPTDWEVIQTATEVLPGIEIRKCTTCNKYEYKYTAPTGAHKYNEGVVTKAPTCTEDGIKTYTCIGTTCDCTEGDRASYTVTIPATGHDKYLDFADANCTNNGHAIVKCHNCDTTFENKTILAKGHNYGDTPTEKVVPTCSLDGKLVYKCTTCADENTITIDAVSTAHNYVKTGEQKATCTQAGYEIYKCEYCEDTYKKYVSNPTAHVVDDSKTVTVDATCNTAGYVYKYCSCGQLISTDITRPNDNHSWETKTELADGCLKSGYSYQECLVCGKIKDITVENSVGHTYEQNVKTEANCTNGGEVEIYCTTCNAVVKTIATSPVGHTYNDGTVTPATCQNEGSVVYTCTVCGDTLTKTLDKIPHEYAFTKSVPATCTSSGYNLYTCKNCSASYKDITSDATAHTYTKDNEKSIDATCMSGGHVYMACSCGAHYEYDVPATGHTYTSEITQTATCTNPQVTTYTCACDYSYTEITAVPTGHVWGEWTTTTAPTEDKAGEQERTCACGEKETAPIPATGAHVMQEDTAQYVAPTCETEGKKVFVCTIHENCSANYTQTIAPLGHNASLEYKKAECGTAGYTKLVCTREDCKKEIESKEIAALEHSFVEVEGSKTYPTCCENGKIDYKCANCGETSSTVLPMTGAHKLKFVETVASTCTEQGYTLYECEYDNCTYACIKDIQPLASHVVDNSKTETINATCSSIGYIKSICSCGAIISVETIPATGIHSYETKTVTGTGCLTSGYSYKECSTCGKVIDITVADSAGHKYKKVTTPATCETDGKVEIICETCNTTIDTITINAYGHNFSGEPTVEKATCEKEGSVTYTCQRGDCDEKLEYKLDKTPHNYKLIGTTDATCTQGGHETYTCLDCGDTILKLVSSATGHTYEADPNNSDVTATCCTDGHVYRKCKDCDAKYDYVVPATGSHVYDSGTVVQNATCLKSEVTEYKCTTDGCTASYREVTADANGHNYTTWTYEHLTATGKCDCADTITVTLPESANHNWVFESISKEATCKSQGYIQFKCDVDGCTAKLYKEYGPIADAHVWNDGEETTKATCTENGVITYTCKECGTTKTETQAKLGHEHTKLVEKVDPTCTTNGYITYQCVRCDDKITNIIEKNESNHSFKPVTVDPTCLEDGYTIEKCEYCSLEGTKTVHEGTALGHHEVVNETKADCTNAGSKITYCDRCNTVIKTESSPALGHDRVESVIKNADCTTEGKVHVTCKRCDWETDETVKALGHNWNDGEVIVKGNCETQQVTRYTCTRCGDTKDVLTGEIAKHNYEFKETVAAKCEQDGYDKWVCSKCGDVQKKNIVKALGHDWGNWTVVTHPTEGKNGLQERYCQRTGCGKREEQVIIYGEFYLVTFYNYDGTRVIAPAYYHYGAKVIRPRVDPFKPADSARIYTFSGWTFTDEQLDFVCENMAVHACYDATERCYNVTYKNENGTVLGTINNVPYSQIGTAYIEQSGKPTKASDKYYDYVFSTWSVSCDTLKDTATAVAVYKAVDRPADSSGDKDDSGENFFTRIINWIKNLFKRIFG